MFKIGQQIRLIKASNNENDIRKNVKELKKLLRASSEFKCEEFSLFRKTPYL